jgi:hypothetical protein
MYRMVVGMVASFLEAVILGRWLQKGIAGGHEKRAKPFAAHPSTGCGQDGLALLQRTPAQDDLPPVSVVT